ncbi:hypothetical protein [Flavobacterium sp. I3-2]|uniref:hypothetical protein n=1 Tax=Flavobacterium sp. I3-2 TaxID=2748319 RepID=UPI0015A87584|nr:hypothetical protein [Flavobacterium sp. I3-2]
MNHIIHLNALLQNVVNTYDSTKDIYVEMYKYYTNFFKEKDILTESDVVIGVGFTYSWMPTILKNLNLSKLDRVTSILNNVKQGVEISDDDLLLLKEFSNNSLVGASKLLHFINPEQYAIWDSWICKQKVQYKLSYIFINFVLIIKFFNCFVIQ